MFLKNLYKFLTMAQEFIQSIRFNKLQLKYFTLKEFDSPDEPGSGSKMNEKFLEKLDYARHNAGVPFKINSGYRSKHWNNKVLKARLNSSHCKGLAADIRCVNSRDRALIIKALLDVGINRIGIAKLFNHKAKICLGLFVYQHHNV